jgi:BirA family transcriptional regulator, biotin operon repressor / biotin---[acetyl-CoA-carboxylase] ligase
MSATFVKNSNSLLPINAKTPIGHPFLVLAQVDSTNIYAIDKVQANLAAHGAAFFAHHQTKGKGQMGKQWKDDSGSNILLTVVINTQFLLISQQFAISIMTALACYDFFSQYAGEETKIKWPNDLYWRDRKAGGILIENHLKGSIWQYSVLGMGININQTVFDSQINNPVSLKQITGKSFDPVALAKELCQSLEKRFQELESGGMQAQLEAYNQILYKKGERVSLKKDNILFQPMIKEVRANGRLVVDNGLEEDYDLGQLVWVIPS